MDVQVFVWVSNGDTGTYADGVEVEAVTVEVDRRLEVLLVPGAIGLLLDALNLESWS